MSRIGKKPVSIPAGVQVKINGSEVTVKGPKGELKRTFVDLISVAQDGDELKVTRPDDLRETRALHGLTRALLNNMVEGVTKGFKKTMVVEGVGYRAEMTGKNLMLYLGYSHPIMVTPPDGIASRLLVTRLRSASSNWTASAITRGTAVTRKSSFTPCASTV